MTNMDSPPAFNFLGTVLLHLLAAVLLHRATVNAASATLFSSLPVPFGSGSAPTSDLQTSTPHMKIRSMYVTCEHPFDEVEAFVDDCGTRYHLDLARIGGGIKEALARYLGVTSLSSVRSSMHLAEHILSSKAPGEGVKVILMGTRRNDPHSST